MVSFTATGISPLVDSQTLGIGPYQLGSFVEGGQFKNLFVDMIEEKGLYHDFWQRRVKARSWKIDRVSV